jgi:hypothetical protein
MLGGKAIFSWGVSSPGPLVALPILKVEPPFKFGLVQVTLQA